MDDNKVYGEWAPKFELENVAIHLHLLPTGKVLYWGRRAKPKQNMKFSSLNEHKTRAFILDIETLESKPTATEPINQDELTVNLFCSGHTFQPDGTLLVVGGHVLDAFGEDQACVYDPFQDTWTAQASMIAGRWYPSAITLSDGRALVLSGSSQDINNPVINLVPQIWDSSKGTWGMTQTPKNIIFPLYPRLYHVPDGRIFMAGPLARSYFLDLTANGGAGEWSSEEDSPLRSAGQGEYGASAMYDGGKILYVSGAGGDDRFPTKVAEIIDLNDPAPNWQKTTDIGKGRRHHFATTLPDGTVLVTGGTQGKGFNNLSEGQPVHEPELWDPVTGEWTVMAPEDDDRCYHHTALLLPDGRVLSAGSGEYAPDNEKRCNDPKDTLLSAQIFSPPYLFKGERPTFSEPPPNIRYNQEFTVTVGQDDVIGKVSWIRLGSVTHTHNMNQSFQFLDFETEGTEVTIKGPTNRSLAPPGHYMLFLVSEEGVPAEASIVRLEPDIPIPILPSQPAAKSTATANSDTNVGITLELRDHEVISQQARPPVVVGLTPTCPYGLGPCWGGAHEALNNISDVATVRPRPNQANSLAFVYLADDDVLPDIDVWRDQLRAIDGGTYTMRGIEMTLTGVVTKSAGQLTLAGTPTRPAVPLNPFRPDSKLEWDSVAKVSRPLTREEAAAHAQLSQAVADCPGGLTVQVTGRLQKGEDGKCSLDVKGFAEPAAAS